MSENGVNVGFLGESDGTVLSIPVDFDAKKPTDWSKVSHGVAHIDEDFVVVEELLCGASNGAVINMDGKNDDSSSHPSIEDSMVIFSTFEPKFDKCLAERLVPSSSSLLKTINGLPKLGDKMTRIEACEVRWKLHEDLFVKISIEECAVEIEDFNGPIFTSSHGEDHMEAGESGNKCKGLSVVNTIDLGETTSNKTGFVLGDLALGVLLDLEDPLAANNVLARWSFDNVPGVHLV